MARKKKTQKDSPTRSSGSASEINDISPRAGDDINDISELHGDTVDAVEGQEPAQKVVYVRLSALDHAEWTLTAERHGEALSELVRRLVQPEVERTLRCLHDGPKQVYPWQTTCLLCGVRISG